jgi:HD-GYP domain-containing protein (c-di-GMP phosphodiesterase class II)
VVREESGKHFDPEVVDAFLSIFDVITAIREKFTEEKKRDMECAIETKLHLYEMERNEEMKKRL